VMSIQLGRFYDTSPSNWGVHGQEVERGGSVSCCALIEMYLIMVIFCASWSTRPSHGALRYVPYQVQISRG